VPRNSREDKNEGTMDRAKGRMKEAGGALTGDKSKKREGRTDQRKAGPRRKRAALKTYFPNRRLTEKGLRLQSPSPFLIPSPTEAR
jgi:uncharacterized protein YjbJ (UPF0337 family)